MPQRALRAADQLRSLAPEGGHLLHMPSHIYMQCGHYYDALAVSATPPRPIANISPTPTLVVMIVTSRRVS